MNRTKIGVAMSGGVDSTVTAALLKKQGFEVHGYFMLLPLPEIQLQIRRLQNITGQLDIPLHLIDLQSSFSDTVIRYFVETYQSGATPNPCVYCNEKIKFGHLLAAMLQQGMEKMATGHYARIEKHNGFSLLRGRDKSKDQSYFLCRLTQYQLRHILLPLGEVTKKEVYGLANEFALSDYNRQESQDVCFLAGNSVSTCLCREGVREIIGDIVTNDGRVVGTHQGVWHYTIGQRKGLGLPDATPWYVTSLDTETNRVFIGKNDALNSLSLTLRAVQWTGPHPPTFPWQGRIQLRSRQQPVLARVIAKGEECWDVFFREPQRAATPGQFGVLYEQDRVVGSGIITQQRHKGREGES